MQALKVAARAMTADRDDASTMFHGVEPSIDGMPTSLHYVLTLYGGAGDSCESGELTSEQVEKAPAQAVADAMIAR
eukprot:9481493-Pyramimonas_sp.AAC.1